MTEDLTAPNNCDREIERSTIIFHGTLYLETRDGKSDRYRSEMSRSPTDKILILGKGPFFGSPTLELSLLVLEVALRRRLLVLVGRGVI